MKVLPDENSSILKYKNFLTQSGIQPSFQRLKILERLDVKRDHPTVNTIYEDLILQIPSLSKTTVYNTLNLFLEKSIVISIDTNDNEAHYDLVHCVHGHFVCLKCKKIYDIELDSFSPDTLVKGGDSVVSTNITIKGICKNCRSELCPEGI